MLGVAKVKLKKRPRSWRNWRLEGVDLFGGEGIVENWIVWMFLVFFYYLYIFVKLPYGLWTQWLVNFRQQVLDWTSNHFFVEADERCGFLFTLVNMPGKRSYPIQQFCNTFFALTKHTLSLLKFLDVPTPSFPLLEGKGAFIGPFRIHSCCGCFCQCWGLREGRGDRRPFFHMMDPPNWWKFLCNLKPRNWYTVNIYAYTDDISIYLPINHNPKL